MKLALNLIHLADTLYEMPIKSTSTGHMDLGMNILNAIDEAINSGAMSPEKAIVLISAFNCASAIDQMRRMKL
jgi:hypothetical protein